MAGKADADDRAMATGSVDHGLDDEAAASADAQGATTDQEPHAIRRKVGRRLHIVGVAIPDDLNIR